MRQVRGEDVEDHAKNVSSSELKIHRTTGKLTESALVLSACAASHVKFDCSFLAKLQVTGQARRKQE